MNTLKLNIKFLAVFVAALFFLSSCSEDEDDGDGGSTDTEEPVASFQFEISETNSLEVTFTNYSQNGTAIDFIGKSNF